MADAKEWGQFFRGLMRCDIFCNMVAAKNNIVHFDGDLTWAMAWQMDQFKITYLHSRLFKREIHLDRMVETLRKAIHTQQIGTGFGFESCLLQIVLQPTANDRETGLVPRDGLVIQFMNADARRGQFAQFGDAAKMVNVSVGDEDVRQVGKCDAGSERGGGLPEPRLQVSVTALTARARVN